MLFGQGINQLSPFRRLDELGKPVWCLLKCLHVTRVCTSLGSKEHGVCLLRIELLDDVIF